MIGGRIRADGRRAGTVVIRAAGRIQLEREISLGSSGIGFDGGTLELDAGSGGVSIRGPIRAEGGSGAQGGTFVAAANSTVEIAAPVVVTGGEFDGGLIEIVSGGDTSIGAALDARATAGGGSGGDVTVEAGGGIELAAGASVLATGNSARTGGLAGDGGSVELRGIAYISAAPDTTVRVDAASPDGSGGIIRIDAGGGPVAIDGILSARGLGTEGGGGSIEILGGTVALGGTSSLDVRGGSEGAGAVTIQAQSDLAFHGIIEAAASNVGAADRVSLQAGAELVFGGALQTGAQTGVEGFDGDVVIAGCLVDMLSLGAIDNSGTFGRNTLRANDVLRIRRGARMSALTPWGRNEIVLGPDAQEPVILGTVSPAPEVRTDPELTTCGVCGNARIDPGETCDDGNTNAGDGCASTCQHEGCIAQTLGWPDQHLCNDGLECTQDSCDTETGECRYGFACDDGHACTIDACAIDGSCVHEPDDGLCNDGNPCTKDVCLVTAGCVGFAQDKPCDDGKDCTGDDVCSEGICRGESLCDAGEHCSNVTGSCKLGTTTSTTTSTTLPSVCGNGVTEAGEDCDDGDTAWTLGEYCRSDCTRLSCGDPDGSGLVRVTDALVVLRAAIGVAECADCICDVDADGGIVARDALVVLRNAVGVAAELVCPACPQSPSRLAYQRGGLDRRGFTGRRKAGKPRLQLGYDSEERRPLPSAQGRYRRRIQL